MGLLLAHGLLSVATPLKNLDQFELETGLVISELESRETEQVASNTGALLSSVQPNVCTNGVNPSTMSIKKYLEEFAKGPCTPLIVLAGFTGSKLQVEIDCPVLKENHPDLFQNCKWTSCKQTDAVNYFSSVPKSEYSLWLPELTSPFSLLSVTKSAKSCFVGMFGFRWDASGQLLKIESPKGVKVTPVGMSPQTISNSACGFDAIANLIPFSGLIGGGKLQQYGPLRTALESMGYKIGLTLQALPYDWRKGMFETQVYQKLETIIDKMHSISGKKVSIAAHSYGNMNVLAALSKMSLDKKRAKLQRYFALGPPFLGAVSPLASLIGGDNQLDFGAVGMDFWMNRNTAGTSGAVFDLMPHKTALLYQSETWMKSINNRKVAEGTSAGKLETLLAKEDLVAQIFPATSQTCFPNRNVLNAGQKCRLGLENFDSFGSVNGEEITSANIPSILEKYGVNPQSQLFFSRMENRKKYAQMEHPGVQTTIIYSTLRPTILKLNWKGNPKEKSSKPDSDFILPNSVEKKVGDGTVLASSSLIPGIKWSSDFLQNPSKLAPIVFAELCSEYNKKSSVYQDGTAKVLRNEYQGIGCKCLPGKEDGCDHVGMVFDASVVEYIAKSLLDFQQPLQTKLFDNTTEDKLGLFVNRCGLLNDMSF